MTLEKSDLSWYLAHQLERFFRLDYSCIRVVKSPQKSVWKRKAKHWRMIGWMFCHITCKQTNQIGWHLLTCCPLSWEKPSMPSLWLSFNVKVPPVLIKRQNPRWSLKRQPSFTTCSSLISPGVSEQLLFSLIPAESFYVKIADWIWNPWNIKIENAAYLSLASWTNLISELKSELGVTNPLRDYVRC